MSLLMTAVLKVPMQFLILATGVFLLIFYQFERPPVFFNPAEIRRMEQGPDRDEFLRRQNEFNTTFDQRKNIASQLIEARRNGQAAEAERLLGEYEASSKQIQAIRKQTSDLIRSTSGVPSNDVNYVYPNFLLNYVPVGVLGLMISVIFAAAMSSISSEIAALSSATMVDFYRRHIKRRGSERHYLVAGRAATVFWGVFATFFATYAGRLGTSLIETVNKVGSHFYGPILGVFLLAFFVKRANGHGAFTGLILGMIAVAYVSWMTQISWLYYNVVGTFVVLLAGTLISLFFRSKPNRDELI